MTLEELLKALAGVQDGQKYTDALKAIVEAKDSDLTAKTNQHKATSKALKDAEDKLKKTAERLTKLSDHIGLDEEAEDLEAALAEASKAGKKGGDEALLKRIAKLEKDHKKAQSDSEALLAAERGKRHDTMKAQAILSSLTAGKAVKPDKLVALLTAAVKVNDDDTMVYVDDKGKEISIQDGVTAWLKANPEFVLSGQNAGGGSGAGTGAAGGEGSFGKQLAQTMGKTAETQIKAQDQYFN